MNFENELSKAIQSKDIRNVAFNLTQNNASANDLIQDVALRAMENKHKFKGGNINAWLAVICKHIFLNNINAKRNKVFVSMPFPELISDNSVENDFELNSIRQEYDKKLYKFVNAVNNIPPQKAVAVLMRAKGYSNSNISKKIGVRPNSVNAMIAVAKKQILSVIKDGSIQYVAGSGTKEKTPIVQIEKSGKVIGKFDSISSAYKKTGIGKSRICDAINGRQKHAGGFIWKKQTA